MFPYEAMHDERESRSPGYVGGEEFLFNSSAGHQLSQDAPGQAPNVGQRFVLALVSLGMLMGMTMLLTIPATTRSAPAWEVFPFLFVFSLFRPQWSVGMSPLAAECGEPSRRRNR